MKAKLKNYKKYKERNKEHELDLNNQANQMHGKCLLLQAKIKVIWTSRTRDMG